MKPHLVKIKALKRITHDVLHIITDKPAKFSYVPGQAVELSINKPGWQTDRRSFYFISIPETSDLEFCIKTYPEHNGVTNEMLKLIVGDELIVYEEFGDISYRGEGLFIAEGVGIAPFLSIFRNLNSRHLIGDNQLIYANKIKADIILETELTNILDGNYTNILLEEQNAAYAHGPITENVLKHFLTGKPQYVYVSGSAKMITSVEKILLALHVSKDFIVKETSEVRRPVVFPYYQQFCTIIPILNTQSYDKL